MRWGNPVFLYGFCLLPVVLGFLMWARRKKRQELRLFAGTAFASLLSNGFSRRCSLTKEILWIFALLLLVLAGARPQWGERWEETKRRGLDIFVAVDLSKSMLAGDISPSRLERAKRKLSDLMPLLQGDRIGLIGFSGEAFVLMPLTLDYNALPLYMESLSPDAISVPGSSLSSAIDLAIRSFESTGSPESHAVLLMSDGEDLGGDVIETIEAAQSKGVQIHTLGIGTPDGAPIPEPEGGFKKDKSGDLILTHLDTSSLEKIAEDTGGLYVRSIASDDDLKLIYNALRHGRASRELKGGRERRFVERYQWFLGLALLLIILEAMIRETKKQTRRDVALLLLMSLFFLPNTTHAFGTIGTIREGEKLYEAGQYEEALQKFLEAKEKNPKDPRLQYNLGNTYHQLNRYDEAGKIFSNLKEGAEKDQLFKERNLYNQGNNQYRQGALDDAIHSYEEALNLDPNDEDARYNLEFVKKKLEEQRKQEQPQQDNNQNSGNDSQQQNQPSEQNSQDQNGESLSQNRREPSSGKAPDEGRRTGFESGSKMSSEEAKRWLSGLKEGRPKVYSGESKKGDSRNVEKDW